MIEKEERFDIVYETMMAMDEVAMGVQVEELDESCDDLIEKFNSDYDEIINYLSNKYKVSLI